MHIIPIILLEILAAGNSCQLADAKVNINSVQFNSIQKIFINSDKKYEYYNNTDRKFMNLQTLMDWFVTLNTLSETEHIVAIDPSNYLII